MTSSSALRRSVFPAIAAIVLMLAACSSSASPTPAAGGGTATVTNGAVTITAASLEFDADAIEAPAGEAFTITLVNNDTVPHNISVYTEEGGERLAEGEIVNAGESTTIDVAALDAGTYYWVCDLHPEMNGSLNVGA